LRFSTEVCVCTVARKLEAGAQELLLNGADSGTVSTTFEDRVARGHVA
jgi:hypothetical protein